MLEKAGLLVLAFSVVLSIVQTVREKPLTSLSLLTGAIASIVAATVFTVLSPAKPPAFLIAIPVVVGLATGTALSFPARLKVEGKETASSRGFLCVAIWSLLLMVSSILVVISPGAARASVAIMLFSCLALSGYSGMLYLRCRVGLFNGVEEAEAGHAG